MKLKVDDKECYYQIGNKRIYVAVVFQSAYDNGNWFADSHDGSPETDYFTDKPFKTKEEAVKHVDETMKDIFKRILDE